MALHSFETFHEDVHCTHLAGATIDEKAGWSCLGDGRRAGRCVPDEGGTLMCRAHCRLGKEDCPAGERCEQVVVDPGESDARPIEGLGYRTE